jgi:hypothetical protein
LLVNQVRSSEDDVERLMDVFAFGGVAA